MRVLISCMPFVWNISHSKKNWEGCDKNVYVWSCRPVFLNRRALASIIPGREGPEEITMCYKISLVQWLIINLNVIFYLSTCHTVYISVITLFYDYAIINY